MVQWWTLDATKYLRPGGTDIGSFSVTADLYVDSNGNKTWDAGDVGVVVGDVILSEVTGKYAGYWSQAHVPVAVGGPPTATQLA